MDTLIYLRYSDDNKRKTFNNGVNNGHGLKNVTCEQTFIRMNEKSKIEMAFSVKKFNKISQDFVSLN